MFFSTELSYRELGGDSSLPSLVRPMSAPRYGVEHAKPSIYGSVCNDKGVHSLRYYQELFILLYFKGLRMTTTATLRPRILDYFMFLGRSESISLTDYSRIRNDMKKHLKHAEIRLGTHHSVSKARMKRTGHHLTRARSDAKTDWKTPWSLITVEPRKNHRLYVHVA